jgi:putative endonuclease
MMRKNAKNKGKKAWYFYILLCKDQSLYSGITNDLKLRENVHNKGLGSAYVRSRGGGKIVYHELLKGKSRALKREAQVKKLSRKKKLLLIGKP